MHVEITSSPQFILRLTMEQVDVLMKLSKMHYDALCRQACVAGENGFIYGWKNSLEASKDWPDPAEKVVTANWRTLDISLKILEITMGLTPEEKLIANDLQFTFCKIISFTRKRLQEWQTTYDTSSNDY